MLVSGIVATGVHCLGKVAAGRCDASSFFLLVVAFDHAVSKITEPRARKDEREPAATRAQIKIERLRLAQGSKQIINFSIQNLSATPLSTYSL